MSSQDPAAITERLTRPFHANVIERKNGMNFIPHEYVRERLIEATGNCFDWTIDQVFFRDDGVTRRSVNRQTGEVPRPHSMVVIGTLSIPGLGQRAGIGAHPLDEGSGEDAAYKSAESDAFKRAAMAFGVGLQQLYIDRTGSSAPRRTSAPAVAGPPPAPISDEVFADQVRKAIATQDGASFRRLADTAGRAVGRWNILIEATDSVPALEWIARHLERIKLDSDDLRAALNVRKEALAA
jgi:hypothetical protein